MNRWWSFLLALAASLSWATGLNGSWHRPFAVLGPAQGLPNGGITCLVQDADGFIWLGTENGLYRYESGQCSRWTREEGLPSDYVDRLVAIPSGGLWVSTARGLARFQNGRIEAVRFAPLTAASELHAMAMDASGHLWAATSQGLFVQTQDLDFHVHPRTPQGPLSTVAPGRAGSMHVGGDRGLWTFHPDGSVESWNAEQGLPRAGVALVGEDGAGRIWACTGRRLVMREPGESRFTDRSRWLPAGVSPNGLFFRDPDGSLWLPTKLGGLRLQDAKPSLLDASAGLPMRWVRSIFRDREGGLWILGPTLARLQGNDRVWNQPLASGSTGDQVWSIFRGAQGDLLVGTDDGVVRMNAAGLQRIPGTEGHRVKAMAMEPSGRLWMVGTTGPTLWLDPGERKAKVAPLGELGTGLNTVLTDSSGRTWIGHPRLGVLRWEPSRRRLVQEVGPGESPSGIHSAFRIREDAMGRIWAATTLGLYVRERSGPWRRFTEKEGILPFGLFGMAFLPDGTAWIFSREPQGLMRIRLDGDQVTVLERRRAGQGIHSDRIYAVEVDPQGRTWASTDQGFDCLDTRTHVGRLEGAISEDCDIQALLAERGRIWVGTSAGLIRYEAGDGEPPAVATLPHILHVLEGDQRLEPPFGALEPVRRRDSSLAFRVAVPSYRHEGQIRIQVRLVGLEEAWRDLDAPLARYPALPGGSYRFEARAAQPDGGFGPVVALPFRVLPHWWRTWWALGLWGLGAASLLALTFRLRMAALAKSKAALETLVAERTEELSHRNLELTEALGRVKQLSGLLPICASCKKIRDDGGYWNQLEQYISDHSDVGFSHGICPECMEIQFPGRGNRYRGRPAEAEPDGE
ncbi:MAG: two-component regulator propeller domain-containing protein [Geothrix sp.]|nr:two-component regulator propeller domain-containing protein [Geothrix sp.]